MLTFMKRISGNNDTRKGDFLYSKQTICRMVGLESERTGHLAEACHFCNDYKCSIDDDTILVTLFVRYKKSH